MKRNALVLSAYKKIGAARGAILPAAQLFEGIEALNLIMQEETARGSDQARHLWAIERRVLNLVTGQSIYGPADGLATNLVEFVAAVYRGAGEDDIPLKLITGEQYTALPEKFETGTPAAIYIVTGKESSPRIYVVPPPDQGETPDVVIGTNGQNYICTRAHTSSSVNRPTTGSDWHNYWDLYTGTTAAITAWTTPFAMVTGTLIAYEYKRPLALFTSPSDDPDMPVTWNRYLLYRLAYDLAPNYSITLEEQQYLKRRVDEAAADLFPSARAQANDYHDKATYF